MIRVSCGSFKGIRAHASQHEPLCVICEAFIAAERVEAERRRPTPPAVITPADIARRAKTSGNVVELPYRGLRRIS